MSTYNTVADADSGVDAANAAVTKASKAVADATVKAANSTFEATVTATKSVVAATSKVASMASDRVQGAEGTMASYGSAWESARKQAQDIADSLTAQSKNLGLAWLDAYDDGFAAYVQLRESLADATQVEAVANLAKSNTQALTDLNHAYSEAVRKLIS